MGITKTDIFSEKQNKMANTFKVLGHPARIAILLYIINQKECICNDLVEEIGLAQATISQHLKELKSLGIIQGSIEGKSVCYCINPLIWNELKKECVQFFDQKIESNNCC